MYNQYNLKAASNTSTSENILINFRKFLSAEKISKGSVRSYVSDVNNFFNWLNGFLEEKHIIPSSSFQAAFPSRHFESGFAGEKSSETSLLNSNKDDASGLISHPATGGIRNDIMKFVSPAILNAYKDYLETNNIPLKTINRRFSALRHFGAFCIDQKICSKNPFDTLRNIPQKTIFPESEFHLGEFRNSLWVNNASKSTIKNYLNDIKQFILWSKSINL